VIAEVGELESNELKAKKATASSNLSPFLLNSVDVSVERYELCCEVESADQLRIKDGES
jgi:hypothetical protein